MDFYSKESGVNFKLILTRSEDRKINVTFNLMIF